MRKEHFDLFCSLMRLSYNDRHLELVAWAEDAAQLTREQQRAFLRDAARLLRESFMLHAGIREVSYLWGEELAFCSKFAPFVGPRNIEPLIAEIESASAQIAQNGSQFLNSDEAPDLMESNRGNGSAGVLSTMGLLTDLGDYVDQYGWDKKVTGANAAVAKYDENGIMDGDTWYGMTSYAEFQRVYYNKDLFAKYGLEIPTTYDEFVDVCQKFVDAGVTPIAADAQEYGVMWLWWQLVSKEADAKFIDNWQLYKGDVDWNSKILTNSVSTINDWLDKGFISHNATGMKAEDTTQAFIKGEYPIYQTGTWNQGRFVKQITTFDWDAAVMPESNFAIGCAGNLLVIPERSHHKDLAAKFIDYVLSDDVQNYLGNAGGIPVAGDASKINDEKSKAMIEEYASYANDGKLSYYPDYAASNLTDAVPAEFQELVNGTKKPADVLKGIHEKYDVGVEDMGVKTN